MSSQLNLENLSNREIKEFWEKTRNEQRKQQGLREAQARANADLGVDNEAPFWIDGFGNRIEGKKLDRKQPAITSMLFFEERVKIRDSDVLLVGRLESQGWLVTSRSADGTFDLKFRLARNLIRDEAIEQATGYATMKAGPQFKDLTDEQVRICQRLACGDRNAAFVYYLQGEVTGGFS